VASHAREEQKGEGIYFDYEPVDDAPTNPKLLELGERGGFGRPI
jgi:hypothetical protein